MKPVWSRKTCSAGTVFTLCGFGPAVCPGLQVQNDSGALATAPSCWRSWSQTEEPTLESTQTLTGYRELTVVKELNAAINFGYFTMESSPGSVLLCFLQGWISDDCTDVIHLVDSMFSLFVLTLLPVQCLSLLCPVDSLSVVAEDSFFFPLESRCSSPLSPDA